VSELNEQAEEMPSNPVANTPIAVATGYLTTCKSVRSHSEALYEGAATIYLAEIRQFTCQTSAIRSPETCYNRGMGGKVQNLDNLLFDGGCNPHPDMNSEIHLPFGSD